MRNPIKKIPLFLLTVFILTAVFFSGALDKRENYFAQASLWDVIKAWVIINPLSVEVSVPAEVEINKVFKVEAKAINKGEEKIENGKAEIFLPEGLSLLKKNPIQKIGAISPRKEKKIRWSIKGEEIGNYFISISVSGELRGQGISDEDSVMVKVIKPFPKGKTLEWFQNIFNSLQEWLKF